MKRSYCRDDKPFPVSEAALERLRKMVMLDQLVSVAPRQIERLRRSGYCHVRVGDDGKEVAFITDAGRALLNGSATQLSESQRSALRWAYCLTAPRSVSGDWPRGSWRDVPPGWLGAPKTVSSLIKANLLHTHIEAGVARVCITDAGAKLRETFR